MSYLNKTIEEKYEWLLAFVEGIINTKYHKKLTKKEQEILLTAFVHKSYAADSVPSLSDNERLEFLGDGVLGGSIASMLYQDFSERSEATLTLYKIALVREEMLASIARDIGLAERLFVSNGEEKQWWRDKDTILADAYEALIGGVYLIYGYECVYMMIHETLFHHIERLKETECKSYKSLLQERAQKKWYDLPLYESIEQNIPWSKETLFETSIHVDNKHIAIGKGKNKKRSHEDAAEKAYKQVSLQ